MLNLQSLRLKNNLTQQQLADLLGLKRKSTVNEWEKGNSIPNFNTLLKLKKLFNFDSVEYLLEQTIEKVICKNKE